MSEPTIATLSPGQARQFRRFLLWTAGIVGTVALIATVSAMIWQTVP